MEEKFDYQNAPQQQNIDVQNAVTTAMQEQKKKKRKKRLIIFAIIAVVIIALIALTSGGDDSDSKQISDSDTVSSQSADETTAAPAEKKVNAGQEITLDNMKVKYISCNADYKDYDEYSAPKSGNKVVRAEFEFENTSNRDISLSNFDCYADNKKCEEFYGADDYASPTLETVSAGRTLTSIVYFEVPENAKTVELEMDDELWGNTKTIFTIK